MKHSKEFHGPGKETWRVLEKVIAKGYDNRRVFEDWLDLTLYQLQHPAKNAAYLEVLGRYNNDYPVGQRPADYFYEAGLLIVQETQSQQVDVLGNMFQQKVSFGNNGQFLTPPALAQLMATLNPPRDGDWVSDPACGSGGLLVETGKVSPKANFHGKDIDAACAKMAALNLWMFQLNGWVEHGDTLRNTLYNVWRTMRLDFGMVVYQLKDTQVAEYQKRQAESLNRRSEKTTPYQSIEKSQSPVTPAITQIPQTATATNIATIPVAVGVSSETAEARLATEFGVNFDAFDEQGQPKEEAIDSENTAYSDLPLFGSFEEG